MTVAALCLAIALAAAVQVVSGFGFALVAAPALVALTDPITSVSIISVLGVVVSTVTLAAGRRRPVIQGSTSATLVATALPGLVLGVVLLTRLPEDVVRAIIGAIVLAALVQRHRGTGRDREQTRPSKPVLAALGVTAGALTTSTGLNGPPMAAVLAAHETPSREARDTLAVVFVALGLLGTAALAISGNFTLPTEALALPPAALVGGVAGHRVFDRLAEGHRRAAVTALLLAAAATAIVPVLA